MRPHAENNRRTAGCSGARNQERCAQRAALRCLLLAPLLFGCSAGDPGQTQSGYSLSIESGDKQTGRQDEPLDAPVVIRISDRSGASVAGLTVRVEILEGDGHVIDSPPPADESGHISIVFEPGSDYSHSARVSLETEPSVAATFTATASYRYRKPVSQSEDGWITGELDQSRPASSKVLSAVDRIRDGTYPEVHSLLVVHRDTLILEAYFGGHDSQGTFVDFDIATPHEVQSASKSFRSLMAGIAIDKGFIDSVDDALFDYLPEYATLRTADKEAITIRHLLTMSTGISWNERNGATNNLSQMYTLPAAQWAGFVLARPMQYEPGSTFVYNTGASILINQVVMNASGQSTAGYVKKYYSDLVESPMIPGIGYPLGGKVLPRDMAKLGQVFLRKGLWKQTRIVSEDWVTASVAPTFAVDGTDGYGYQWWSRTLYTSVGNFDCYYAGGNGGQFIIVVDDLDLVVVATGGNFDSSVMYQIFGMVSGFVIPGLS